MLPQFTPNGTLPPGIYWATWDEVVRRFGTNTHRLTLLAHLKAVLDTLRAVGCERVYLDGSFVSEKQYPNDFDACWDAQAVNIVALLALDPSLLPTNDALRALQKAKHRGDIFVAQGTELGSGMRFLAFFQRDRQTGGRKGIVGLDLRGLP